MYRQVNALRRRARWLRVGAWMTAVLTVASAGAAGVVNGYLIDDCAWCAFFLGVFSWWFFEGSAELYRRVNSMDT